MNKLYFFFCLGVSLIWSHLAYSATGDTTHVNVQNKLHLSSYGNYDSVINFTSAGVSASTYNRIWLKVTLGCPSSGCSDWDYTVLVHLREIFNNMDTNYIELARLITPYAGRYSADWEYEYWYDITELAPVLKGQKQIRTTYSGYQDGFAISLDFYFLEGQAPRTPLRVLPLYDGYFKYGRASDPIEDHLTPYNYTYNANETSAILRFTPTGHSFGGNENCAEFCPKYYRVNLNNNQIAQKTIWDNTCGSNPLYNQAGTWIYNRANWCPGKEVIPFLHELPVTAGSQTIDVDMEPFTHTTGSNGDPGYSISSNIVTLGAWNYNTDVSIEEILAPNNEVRHNRYNPTCQNPVIRVQNRGKDIIQFMDIEYGTTNSLKRTYRWTGSIASMEIKDIEIPTPEGIYFIDNGTDKRFKVTIKTPNGILDENVYNNTKTSDFDQTKMFPNTFIVRWKPNNATSETSWKVIDEEGTVVASSPANITSSTLRKDTVVLPDEKACYKFVLEDTDCDGLEFFANNDGSGYMLITQLTNRVLHRINADFGCKLELGFTVNYLLSDNSLDKSLLNKVKVYPVPINNNVLNIDFNLDSKQDIQIRIIDALGRKVMYKSYTQVEKNSYKIDVSELKNGRYILTFFTPNSDILRYQSIIKR